MYTKAPSIKTPLVVTKTLRSTPPELFTAACLLCVLLNTLLHLPRLTPGTRTPADNIPHCNLDFSLLPASRFLPQELSWRLFQSIPIYFLPACERHREEGRGVSPGNRHMDPDFPKEAATPAPKASRSLCEEQSSRLSYSTQRTGHDSHGRRLTEEPHREMRFLLLNQQSATPTAGNSARVYAPS